MHKSITGSQRDYIVEINEANTHEEIKSSDCRKIKFQNCFATSHILSESTFASETKSFLLKEKCLNDKLCN